MFHLALLFGVLVARHLGIAPIRLTGDGTEISTRSRLHVNADVVGPGIVVLFDAMSIPRKPC